MITISTAAVHNGLDKLILKHAYLSPFGILDEKHPCDSLSSWSSAASSSVSSARLRSLRTAGPTRQGLVRGGGGRVVAQLPRNYPASAHSVLYFIGAGRYHRRGDLFFAAQLPGGVHRTLCFTQDLCRVVG